MCRKALGGFGLLAVGAMLWMSTSLGSYVRTGYHESKKAVGGMVPIQFELKVAKDQLATLDQAILDAKRQIAEHDVRVSRQHREIARIEDNLAREKVAIMELRKQLDQGLTSGRGAAPGLVKTELNRRFVSYQRVEDTLQTKKEIVASQQSAQSALAAKYEELLSARQSLESELAALDARHKLVEAKKTANVFQIDDTKLSRVRTMIEALQDRIAVEEAVAEQEGNIHVPTPSPVSDIGQQVDSYFGKATPAKSVL